jgi:hypothetical protein
MVRVPSNPTSSRDQLRKLNDALRRLQAKIDQNTALIEALQESSGSGSVSFGSPVAIADSANSDGVATTAARSDHVHAHGNRSGGSLHALANTTTAGFMSADHFDTVEELADRWVTVRELDFSLWPQTDFAVGGDGTYNLDDGGGSLTWTVEDSSAANGVPGFFRRNNADVGGDGASGIRIRHDQSLSTVESAATSSAPKIGIALGSLIPDYDETQTYLIEVQITRITETGTVPTSARVGMVIRPHPSAPVGAGRTWEACYVRNGADTYEPTSAANNTPRSARRTDKNWGVTDVLAIEVGPQCKCVYAGAYSAGWPAESALDIVAYRADTASADALLQALNERTMFLWLTTVSASSAAGDIDVMFRRLRVRRQTR